MSRLSELYEAMETLRKNGVDIPDKLEKQVSDKENEIIQNEILPIVKENIAPALQQVKRELVLVVDYVPGEQIRVNLSRKRNVADGVYEQKEIFASVEEHSSTHRTITHRHEYGRDKATRLRIVFPSGEIMQGASSEDTLEMFVRFAGIERVRPLGFALSAVPLISNYKDSKYSKAQRPLGNGLYLITHSNTIAKKRIIENIASRLGIKLKVEII